MHIEKSLIDFAITIVFSFLIGLEVKTYKLHFHEKSSNYFFGSARTFTFVGMLGFLFYHVSIYAYLMVLASLSVLYAMFYYQRLLSNKQSIILFLVLLIVYSFGPISINNPIWMTSLVFVLVIFVLNAKVGIQNFSNYINKKEFETLGKMVLLSAVILPLLPNKNVIPYIPISPFKIWLVVVVVSAISYGGYIAQKYFFPSKGYFLTGLIGGVYSSTATTVVLARKAKLSEYNPVINGAIIVSTSVMYLRLIIVAFIFNVQIAKSIILPFVIFACIGIAISLIFLYSKKRRDVTHDFVDDNPLELRTAFIFAILFIAMMALTKYITSEFGSIGLQIFSFVAGFTDIDPFILSLLTGKYAITSHEIFNAILIAAGSNNLLKAVYALWFGGWKNTHKAAFWISVLGIATIAWSFV
jgi:uncharacterized membrane protein (DUF4010 family)